MRFGPFRSAPRTSASDIEHAGLVDSAKLKVLVCSAGERRWLEVRSASDLRQLFILPLDHHPSLEGLSSFTELGRLHGRCWALAYGTAVREQTTMVRFDSGTLRYRTFADCAVTAIGGDVWIAQARGRFATASLFVEGHETQRVRLVDPG